MHMALMQAEPRATAATAIAATAIAATAIAAAATAAVPAPEAAAAKVTAAAAEVAATATGEPAAAGRRGSHLEAHNVLRMLHGVQNLTWSSSLAAAAQDHAEQCAWEHSYRRDAGENMILGRFDTPQQIAQGTAMWYSEICNYDWNDPGYSDTTGHFTQVVWAATSRIGCGYKVCDSVEGAPFCTGRRCGVYTCQYQSPGNWLSTTQFVQNVRRPSAFPAQCKNK
ncbi:hypothetical protein GPECTOR_75g736 [Gonium pectorale]|uniref:SCP domain-containing protein n=1 Tax=Gonium pectorale TaxID=33097 RepID=A0A150G2C0_GONPE|nr:hypothetical protein GPECTOR_75g736 [Gonium pectorale]|eukprot:KXZ44012.1 hypothetical protein GPECTOR_75g736 [Gonium pectorale]